MSWHGHPHNPGAAPPPPAGYYGNQPSQPHGYHQQQQPQQRGYPGQQPGQPYPPQQQGGYPPPPGGQWGGSAPPPPAGPPPGIDPTLWNWFKSVDQDNSGSITSTELRHALVNNNWSHFNEETCRLLVGMFDKDSNGTIDVHEFVQLWKYIQDWKGCFDRFDSDRSGNIDSNELQQALSAFGYRVSVEFCKLCTRGFDRNNQNSMKFDDFIQCCVMIKGLTESFQRLDPHRSGVVNINYEQFLEMAIDTTVQ